jgi:hypothetical protein
LRIVGPPAPLGVYRPQRHVREQHDRRAGRQTRDVLLEPRDLLGAE